MCSMVDHRENVMTEQAATQPEQAGKPDSVAITELEDFSEMLGELKILAAVEQLVGTGLEEQLADLLKRFTMSDLFRRIIDGFLSEHFTGLQLDERLQNYLSREPALKTSL